MALTTARGNGFIAKQVNERVVYKATGSMGKTLDFYKANKVVNTNLASAAIEVMTSRPLIIVPTFLYKNPNLILKMVPGSKSMSSQQKAQLITNVRGYITSFLNAYRSDDIFNVNVPIEQAQKAYLNIKLN